MRGFKWSICWKFQLSISLGTQKASLVGIHIWESCSPYWTCSRHVLPIESYHIQPVSDERYLIEYYGIIFYQSRYLNHQLNVISFNLFQIFDTSLLNCIISNKFLAFHNNSMHSVQDISYQLNGIMFITLWTRMGILDCFLIAEKLERVKEQWKLRMSTDFFANTSHDILRCPKV